MFWIIYLHLNFKFIISVFLWYNRFTFKQKGAMIASRDILNLGSYKNISSRHCSYLHQPHLHTQNTKHSISYNHNNIHFI